MNLITSRLVPITFLAVISVAKALLGFYFGINVFFLVVFLMGLLCLALT